jgi:hypothetical protein
MSIVFSIQRGEAGDAEPNEEDAGPHRLGSKA